MTSSIKLHTWRLVDDPWEDWGHFAEEPPPLKPSAAIGGLAAWPKHLAASAQIKTTAVHQASVPSPTSDIGRSSVLRLDEFSL